jgi:hypothetical protein
MKETARSRIERREFFRDVCSAAVASALFGSGLRAGGAPARPPADAPHTHNMLVVGGKAVYLSHLPMFEKLNRRGTDYLTPHRYQVILEAGFASGANDLQGVYTTDRANNPDVRIYTLNPEDFVLPRLAAGSAPVPLTSFKGTVFRGHLEKGGSPVEGLRDVTVNVKRVVHFRKFNPREAKPARLEYLLFGKPDELFLAHFISKPPDFDQVLSVKIGDRSFTEEELGRGLRVQIPDRANTALKRLKEGQQAPGAILTGGTQTPPAGLQIQAGTEFYFEEGELRIPATFNSTAEEKSSGFA